MGERFYTVKEAAGGYFQGKVSPREVYHLYALGQLRGFRVGAKILIYESSLDAYRSGQENHAPPAPAPARKARRREEEAPKIRLSRLPE
jgi:hypothetical protein